jgi:histidine decarboxylase
MFPTKKNTPRSSPLVSPSQFGPPASSPFFPQSSPPKAGSSSKLADTFEGPKASQRPIDPELTQHLDARYEQFSAASKKGMGYPPNLEFRYRELGLDKFNEFHLNNAGDPYIESPYALNTHAEERKVVDFFAELFRAPPGNTWGYVTTGGTAGNHYAMGLARMLLPDAPIFYSSATHYSLDKITRLLSAKRVKIASHEDGTIDLQDLEAKLKANESKSAIVLANIGTTMTGAVDDVPGILRAIESSGTTQHYLHSDAALSGMILPFVDNPQPFDFEAGANSVSVSLHKMFGLPWPAGVVLAEKDKVDRLAMGVEYIRSLDTTLEGSRNGHSPLYAYARIRDLGMEGFREQVQGALQNAEYAVNQLKSIGVQAWRNQNSVTVVFKAPKEVANEWGLATQEDKAHLITMPNISRQQIDELVRDVADVNEESEKAA